MHLLVVSQYFWPEDFRVNDLVSGLENRGHKVTVLTGLPNYPSGLLDIDFIKNPSKYHKYNKTYYSSNLYDIPKSQLYYYYSIYN